jgi:hypothetical protein
VKQRADEQERQHEREREERAEQPHQGQRDEHEPNDGEGQREQREQEDSQSGGQVGELAQALGEGFWGAGRVHGSTTAQPPAV